MTNNLRVAIIGGGPSGLLLARLLELQGFTNYIVFERDESAIPGPRQQGGTLDLHETTGQLALKRAGLFEEFSTSLARWDGSAIHVVDPQGTTFMKHDSGSRPEIDRLQLRQLLLSAVPAEKIRWGHGVASVEKNAPGATSKHPGNGYTINFKNGTSASGFDLIVGADGTWSKVRRLITSANPKYSGKMFIEGRISQSNPVYAAAQNFAGPGNSMALGFGKNLNIQKVADGTYRVYFGVKVPENFHDRQAVDEESGTEELRHRFLESDFFGDWASHLKEFVKHAEGPFRSWRLYRFDPEEVEWSRKKAPGVTILGDAGHCTTPFAGEGVNCSMQDAVVLADAILRECGASNSGRESLHVRLEQAIAGYERDMFVRGQDLIRKSMMIEEVMYRDNGAKALLALFSRMAEAASEIN